MRGYEAMEDHLAGTKNIFNNAPDREGTVREFYSKVTLTKGVYEKLVGLYRNVDTLALPNPDVSQLSKTLPKAMQIK